MKVKDYKIKDFKVGTKCFADIAAALKYWKNSSNQNFSAFIHLGRRQTVSSYVKQLTKYLQIYAPDLLSSAEFVLSATNTKPADDKLELPIFLNVITDNKQ